MWMWHPIETAPKDGTEILAYSKTGGTGVMLVSFIAAEDFLTPSELEHCIKAGMADEELSEPAWFYADFTQGDRLDDDCQPTHWMHLPKEPY